MKKQWVLIVFAVLAITSCSKVKTSNNASNNSAESVNSVNKNSSPILTNSNQNIRSDIKLEVDNDMLKKIEAQQLETSDPRKVVRENKTKNNQSPKNNAAPGRQTW